MVHPHTRQTLSIYGISEHLTIDNQFKQKQTALDLLIKFPNSFDIKNDIVLVGDTLNIDSLHEPSLDNIVIEYHDDINNKNIIVDTCGKNIFGISTNCHCKIIGGGKIRTASLSHWQPGFEYVNLRIYSQDDYDRIPWDKIDCQIGLTFYCSCHITTLHKSVKYIETSCGEIYIYITGTSEYNDIVIVSSDKNTYVMLSGKFGTINTSNDMKNVRFGEIFACLNFEISLKDFHEVFNMYEEGEIQFPEEFIKKIRIKNLSPLSRKLLFLSSYHAINCPVASIDLIKSNILITSSRTSHIRCNNFIIPKSDIKNIKDKIIIDIPIDSLEKNLLNIPNELIVIPVKLFTNRIISLLIERVNHKI